jgi:hypothetical protein
MRFLLLTTCMFPISAAVFAQSDRGTITGTISDIQPAQLFPMPPAPCIRQRLPPPEIPGNTQALRIEGQESGGDFLLNARRGRRTPPSVSTVCQARRSDAVRRQAQEFSDRESSVSV